MNMEHLNAVLAKYRKMELPVMENSIGALLIKPTFRKKMKQEIQEAWIEDLKAELDPEVVEILLNADGIMIICQNDIEGFYTIENMVKIKNIDYDPQDCSNIE